MSRRTPTFVEPPPTPIGPEASFVSRSRGISEMPARKYITSTLPNQTMAETLIQQTFGRQLGLEREHPERDRLLRNCTVFTASMSWMGIILMLVAQLALPDLEKESFSGLWLAGLIVQLVVSATTLLAIGGILMYYRVYVRYGKIDSIMPSIGPEPQFSFIHSSGFGLMILQIIVHLFQPVPYYFRSTSILSVLMLLRLYLFLPILKFFSIGFRHRFEIFCKKGQRISSVDSPGAGMMLRVFIHRHLISFFSIMVILSIGLMTFFAMIMDREEPFNEVKRSFWYATLNFLLRDTEEKPSTDGGKVILVLITVAGIIAANLLTAILTNKMIPTSLQLIIVSYITQYRRTQAYKVACVRVCQAIFRKKMGSPVGSWSVGRSLVEMRRCRQLLHQEEDSNVAAWLNGLTEAMDGLRRSLVEVQNRMRKVEHVVSLNLASSSSTHQPTHRRNDDRVVNHLNRMGQQMIQIEGRLHAIEVSLLGLYANQENITTSLKEVEITTTKKINELHSIGIRSPASVETTRSVIENVIKKQSNEVGRQAYVEGKIGELEAILRRIEATGASTLQKIATQDPNQQLQHPHHQQQQQQQHLLQATASLRSELLSRIDHIALQLLGTREELKSVPALEQQLKKANTLLEAMLKKPSTNVTHFLFNPSPNNPQNPNTAMSPIPSPVPTLRSAEASYVPIPQLGPHLEDPTSIYPSAPATPVSSTYPMTYQQVYQFATSPANTRSSSAVK